MRRKMGILCALAVVAFGSYVALLWWAAQRRHDEPALEPGLLPLDPGLVYRESALTVDLAGNGRGLLKLGEGWYQERPRSPILRRHWDSGVGPKAMLYFARPAVPTSMALEIALAPLDYAGAPVQELKVILNRRRVFEQSLANRLQTVRVPLPWKAMSPGINRIQLRFAHAASPRKVGLGTEVRAIAAQVAEVGLRAEGGGEGSVQSSALDVSSRTLRLMPGSPVEVPLPAARQAKLLIRVVSGAMPSSSLEVSLLDRRDGVHEILRRPVSELPTEPLLLPLRRGRMARLWLNLEARVAPVAPLELSLTLEPVGSVARESAKPDIFVFTVDTLRADALGLYGYSRATSPNLDSLAAEAVVFERAWSTSAWTLPSTMSLLTGKVPQHHGFVHAGFRPQRTQPVLLAELLRSQGYDTVAIVQNPLVSEGHGFDRGFDTFYPLASLSRGGGESADVPWYLWNHLVHRRHPERPLFVYIHVVEPHDVYSPQDGDRLFAEEYLGLLRPWQYQASTFIERGLVHNRREVGHLRGLYDGEVRRSDRQLGRLLDVLRFRGLYDSSLFVFLSDHGETFSEHGTFGHGQTLYEELLHVPLVIRFPEAQGGGQRVRQRVSLVDLVPTVLELLGVETEPFRFDGKSLLRPDRLSDRRRLSAETRPSRSESTRRVDLRAVVVGNTKCIASSTGYEGRGSEVARLRSFDLAADPQEMRPRESERADDRCSEWLAEAFGEAGSDDIEPLSEEERESLRALGYL